MVPGQVGQAKQALLYSNERIACFVGDHLIADHPVIETYLRSRARHARSRRSPTGRDRPGRARGHSRALGLEPGRYLTLVARPIPENSILEIVQGFSRGGAASSSRSSGTSTPRTTRTTPQVRAAASDEVAFLGAIYDPATVQALRFHRLGYLHGHTVGGTNPSLVEAMAAATR